MPTPEPPGCDDAETWTLAVLLLRKHGLGALEVAERKSNEALEGGDVTGATVWSGVARAVEELLRPPEEGERWN
jgi:hypothetical protein